MPFFHNFSFDSPRLLLSRSRSRLLPLLSQPTSTPFPPSHNVPRSQPGSDSCLLRVKSSPPAALRNAKTSKCEENKTWISNFPPSQQGMALIGYIWVSCDSVVVCWYVTPAWWIELIQTWKRSTWNWSWMLACLLGESNLAQPNSNFGENLTRIPTPD